MRGIHLKCVHIVIIVFSFALMIVSGCGGEKKWFRDRSGDYKNTESCRTIQIPSDVNADAFSSEYRVSEQ